MPPATKVIKRRLLSFGLIAGILALTLYFGLTIGQQRRLYLAGVAVVTAILALFFWRFERRRPGARELAVLAVMCAIGVVGRLAFFMLPNVKPMTAVVILTGVSFGAESGFVAGAMTALVSNFYFGQGPHTPWQMLALGLVGYLAGLLFHAGPLPGLRPSIRLPKKRLPLCIYGGLVTLLLYSGITDLGTMLLLVPAFSWQALLAVYATGLYHYVIHAASTVVFLLLGKPLMDILDRIRKKYGLFGDGAPVFMGVVNHLKG